MDPLAYHYVHEIGVARKTRGGAQGQTLRPTAIEKGYWSDKRTLVVGTDGKEVTAQASAAFPASVELIPLGSVLTAPASFGNSKSYSVIGAAVGIGAPGAPNHQEVYLG